MNLDHMFIPAKSFKTNCAIFAEDLIYVDALADHYKISRSHCMCVLLDIYFIHSDMDKEIPRATRKQEAGKQVFNVKMPITTLDKFQAHRQNFGCSIAELTHEVVLMHQQLTQ